MSGPHAAIRAEPAMGSADSSLEAGVDSPLTTDGPLRIAIRSQRRLLRDTLAMCLAGRPDLEVVGHVAGVDDLLSLCELRPPDVVLLALSEDSPLTWLGDVRERFEQACLVLLYESLTADDLLCARQAGADVMMPCSHGLDALMSVLDRCADQVASQGRPPAPAALTETERRDPHAAGAGHTVVASPACCRRRRTTWRTPSVASTNGSAWRPAARRWPGRWRWASSSGTRRPTPARRHRPRAPRSSSSAAPTARRRQQVVTVLLARGIPFVLGEQASTTDPSSWLRWHRGPLILLLVDPTPEDLPDPHAGGPVAAAAHVPVVLVRTRPSAVTRPRCSAGAWVPSSRSTGARRTWCRR